MFNMRFFRRPVCRPFGYVDSRSRTDYNYMLDWIGRSVNSTVQTIITVLILVGSLLMIYNICRYGAFVKKNVELERQGKKKTLLFLPLLLLIFFLVGYLVAGATGIANLLIASILFGGSVFVFMLIWVMYSIVGRLWETDQVLSNRYEEMKAELDALTKDSMSAFRVNLTRDEVEERSGEYLYDTDLEFDAYSQLIEARQQYAVDEAIDGRPEDFTRDGLIRLYMDGQTRASETLLVHRKDGEVGFVRLEANLMKKAVSGDVVAFLTERPCNEDVVKQALLERVLLDRYDRIAYIIDGRYRVLVSNDGRKSNLLLPGDREDSYESLYLNYILPALSRDREKGPGGENPLRLSVIDKALAKEDVYEVNAPFIIEGETRYKHFAFYVIDRKARYYLMLLSDSTQMQEEQAARNRRLAEALASAVEAGESRAALFAGVTRDLREPADTARRALEEIRGEAGPEAQSPALDRAEQAVRQLISLSEGVYALGRIEAGHPQEREEAVDLRGFVRELAAQGEALRPEKNIRFRAETGGLFAPVVLCDGDRLRLVLARLLENSSVFAPAGGTVTLSVSQSGEMQGEAAVCEFRLRDPASQIPPKVLERLFDPSAWDESDRVRELPGVRMGMILAREYVEHLGGTIRVDSGAEGTEFHLRLPFLPALVPEEETPDPAVREGRQLRILLADDNEINRELGELMLTAEGWEVTLARDGAEAADKAASAGEAPFDLVLMDVQMPVLNGYEATARIRALPDPALAGVPIIALTANADEETARAAREAGMNGYAPKPLDIGRLRALIEELLPSGAAEAP